MLGITLLPALLLLVVHVAFSGSLTFVAQNLYLLPAIAALFGGPGAPRHLHDGGAVVALEEPPVHRRSPSPGSFFFTTAMYQALQRITGSRLWALLSPRDLLGVIGDAAFRTPGPRAVPVWAALLAVAVMIGVSILVLERRVRGVEVVR